MGLTWKPTPGATAPYVVDAPEGSQLKLGDRISWTEVKHGRWAEMLAYSLTRTKGTALAFALPGQVVPEGSGDPSWIVEDTQLVREKPGRGRCTVQWYALWTPPPDDWSIVPLELNPPLTSAGYFSDLTDTERDQCEGMRRAATPILRMKLQNAVTNGLQGALMAKLLAKWRRGMETFYVAGLKYQWTKYYYTYPGVNRGGYRETPTLPSGVSAWPSGISWMRLSDECIYSSGLYKWTGTWLGGPSGHWDTDIYPT